MSALEPCGTTELQVDQLSYIWEIRRIDQLVNPKIRPLCKLKSPTFTAGTLEDGSPKQWHLELFHTKNDWMKCRLVPENFELPTASSTDQSIENNNDNNTNIASTSNYNNSSINGNSQKPPTTTFFSNILSSTGSGVSDMTLTSSQIIEKMTGSVVYHAGLLTTDGKLESLKDMLDKSEEVDNWVKWATNFCEKRRKMGCVEFLFGENVDYSVNAIPIDYLWTNREKYVRNNSIKLQVELVFTRDVATEGRRSAYTPPQQNISRVNTYENIPNIISNNNNNNNNNNLPEKSTLDVQSAFYKLVLAEKIGNFLNNEQFSDIVLKCGERLFHAHKLILFANAENFARFIFNAPRYVPPSTNNNNNNSIGPTTPTPAHPPPPDQTANTEIILVENICPYIFSHFLEFVYKAEVSGDKMSMQAICNLAKVAKIHSMHDLYLTCLLHSLEKYKKIDDGTTGTVIGSAGPSTSNQLTNHKNLLKELFQSADPLVFQHCSTDELRRSYPTAFAFLDSER